MIERVLLVDDERIQRLALERTLRRLVSGLGWNALEIRHAETGTKAVEISKVFNPQLIFMDIKMPGITGLEASKQILNLPQVETDIVVLTAYDEFSYAQQALNSGALAYLLKPVDRDQLLAVLQQVLERWQNRNAEQTMRRQLERVRPYIKMEILQDCIKGNIKNMAELSTKLELVGEAFYPRLVWLLELDERSGAFGSETERQYHKGQFIQEITSLLNVGHLAARLDNCHFVILSDVPAEIVDEEDIRLWQCKLAESMIAKAAESGQWTVTMGLSRLARGIAELPQAFAEAEQALLYKYVMGKGQIIHIADIDISMRFQAQYPVSLEKELLEAVRLGRSDTALQCLKQLLETCLSSGIAGIAPLRSRMLELVVLAGREAVSGGADESSIRRAFLKALEELDNLYNLAALEQWTSGYIEECCREVASSTDQRNRRLIITSVQYLKEHYTENITLEDMSRVVYLSPYYFSHLFKKEMGVSFVEYLTSLRIEESKRLLRETPLYISAVAAKVGYSDVNYFSRVFKKMTGMTPSQYRKSKASVINNNGSK